MTLSSACASVHAAPAGATHCSDSPLLTVFFCYKTRLRAQAEEQSILIRGGESARVALTLTPLRPGALTVTGLDWVLNGHAPGYRLFAERRAHHRRSASKCVPCVPGHTRVRLCLPAACWEHPSPSAMHMHVGVKPRGVQCDAGV